MSYIKKLLFLATPFFFLNCTPTKENSSAMNTDDPIEKKVDSLLSLMTLQEKIGQLNQYNGTWDVTGPPSDASNEEKLQMLKTGRVGSMLNVTSALHTREAQRIVMENTRLKIPLIFGYDVIHGYKTLFPIPLGESASWDMEAIQKSGEVAAKEATAAGLHWTFAPMVDIARDARWGRIMEGAGEDPYLGAKIAVARVKGFQGEDLSKQNTMAACAKHLAAYGFAEAGKDYNTVTIGDADLHNIVLPPFKAAADAGVATFMTSFNETNGIPATADKMVIRDILKDGWNWDGFVISDWASIGEMINHGYSKDKTHASEQAMNAGVDMDMEARAYEVGLEEVIKKGSVKEALLDDAVRRILRIKFRLGLFEDPYRYSDEQREKEATYTAENHAASRDVAKKSIVLLKNEGNLLPLKKSGQTIAVIGALANDKDTPLGSWRAKVEANSAISLLEGIKAAVSDQAKVTYTKGVDVGIGERSFIREQQVNRDNTDGINKATKFAASADVVVLAVGEEAFMSGEGRSQVDIQLTMPQQKLIDAISKVNKNIVLVVMNGRPLALSNVETKVPSMLETWHLGSQSGNAIADVLFGDYNPSGKLPVSFPRHVGQLPFYYNYKNTGRPSNNEGMVFYSHYTDEEKTPLFPFGHGLSYTTFKYADLVLDKTSFSADGNIKASVTLTNTGKVSGKEVVQWYIRDLIGSLTRPVRELKGFEIVELAPGESKTVSFQIDSETVQFYTANKKWEAEAGDFKLFVGGSSITALETEFELVK